MTRIIVFWGLHWGPPILGNRVIQLHLDDQATVSERY